MTSPKKKPGASINIKPLLFTFLGAFILFFFAFTVILPIIAPQVEIPALTEDYSMSSVTSDDFKGRIDPRLKEIEGEEEKPAAPKLKIELTEKTKEESEKEKTDANSLFNEEENENMPEESIPAENDDWNYTSKNKISSNTETTKASTQIKKPAPQAPIVPPRPNSVTTSSSQQNSSSQEYKPIKMSKVMLGSYSTPMQARLVSDALIEMDFNVAPFIKERNGRYYLQLGSFSSPSQAESLVQELKEKSFNAQIVQE